MGQDTMESRQHPEPVDDSFDGLVAVVDSRGKIVSCTPALCSALGYAPPELLGRTVSEVAQDEGRGLLGPAARAAAGFAEGPVSFFRRDGRSVRMFCRRSPYLRGTGETYAFIDCRPQRAGEAAPATGAVSPRPGERALLRTRIRHGLSDGEFVVYYQPLVDLARGVPCGVEALVRWQSAAQGLIGLGGFVPFAEETGQIREIGEHVLRIACRNGKSWLDQGAPSEQLGVNVSAGQLSEPGFVQLVDSILRETGFPARLLELEATEKTLAGDRPGMLRTLAALREVGVTLAVDDFGTSSTFGTRSSAFDRLRLLPLNRLKIDGAFIRGMTDSSAGAQTVAALIAMGHSLGADVAAECVETGDQVRLLRELGCLQAQGFYFSKAVPPASAAQLFGRRAPTVPSFSSSELLP